MFLPIMHWCCVQFGHILQVNKMLVNIGRYVHGNYICIVKHNGRHQLVSTLLMPQCCLPSIDGVLHPKSAECSRFILATWVCPNASVNLNALSILQRPGIQTTSCLVVECYGHRTYPQTQMYIFRNTHVLHVPQQLLGAITAISYTVAHKLVCETLLATSFNSQSPTGQLATHLQAHRHEQL